MRAKERDSLECAVDELEYLKRYPYLKTTHEIERLRRARGLINSILMRIAKRDQVWYS